jgi:hypothetical protein
VEVDYRFAKSEFITAKKLLEDMAGLHFTNKLKMPMKIVDFIRLILKHLALLILVPLFLALLV